MSPLRHKMRKNKYNAHPTKRHGYSFDSQAEARYYDDLRLRFIAGEVLWYARQVPIDLDGGAVYRVDFLEARADGTLHFIDVKGHETDVFRLKKRLVEDRWPIEVEIVPAKKQRRR